MTAKVFVRAWAAALIIHAAFLGHARLEDPSTIAVVGLGFAVLANPKSGRLFASLALAQVADAWIGMPTSPSNWMIEAFANVAILLTMVRHKSLDIALVPRAFPAIRLILLVGYSAAAIAKYNSAFLDTASSCANQLMSLASAGRADWLADSGLVVGLVLVTETSVPILLLIPATRRYGVRIAIAFHVLLGMNPDFTVPDFTSGLVAMWLLFLSDRDMEGLVSAARSLASRSGIYRDMARHPRMAAAVGFLLAGFSGWADARVGTPIVWVFSTLYLVGVLVAAWISLRVRADPGRIGLPSLITVPAIAIAVLWVVQPYLGGRTNGVMTMFSGLYTNPGIENHLFLPSVDLAGWQSDIVYITDSNDPEFLLGAKNDLGVPLLGLRLMAVHKPGVWVEGVMNGRRVLFGSKVGATPLEAPPWWQRHHLLFRPVPAHPPGFCPMA